MIKSLNTEISEAFLEEIANELEERPEMSCTAHICGAYSGVCLGVISSSGLGIQAW